MGVFLVSSLASHIGWFIKVSSLASHIGWFIKVSSLASHIGWVLSETKVKTLFTFDDLKNVFYKLYKV